MSNYTIQVGTERIPAVDAERIVIKGLEEFELFVHRSHISNHGWCVSEAVTGRRFIPFLSTDRCTAIVEAHRKAKEKGAAAIREAIAKAKEGSGDA